MRIEPFDPEIVTRLGRATETAVATCATMPEGKRSTAADHASTPVSAKLATARTSSGSSSPGVVPAAAAAIRRHMDTA